MSNTFDPSSPRAIAGLEFQNKVLEELRAFSEITDVEETREFFKREDPGVSDFQLNILEKHFGDITFIANDKRYWVECCLAMGQQRSLMCERKRMNFQGDNRWYCYGKMNSPEERVYIPAYVWRAYTAKCPMVSRDKWLFRQIKPRLIGSNIRAAKLSNQEFVSSIIPQLPF